MSAYLYLRKSVMRDPSKTLSPQVQEQRLRALASANGDEDPVVIADLDVSGARADRPSYQRLVDAIESGEATAVYAYDLSRLHRNRLESERFWQLVERTGVPVRLTDMVVDTSTAAGRMTIGIFAVMNAWMSEVASEKMRASVAARRARGDSLGGRAYGTRPGEDAAAVVEALRSEGSTTRAARRLNEARVPTRNAASRGWSPSAVLAVASRLDPELVASMVASGPRLPGSSRGPRAHKFARLLRCGTCGALLTPSTRGQPQRGVSYFCHFATTTPHARASVSEPALVPAVMEAVERTRLAARRVRRTAGSAAVDLDALAARRRRVLDNYEDGLIDRAARDAKLAAVADREARAVSTRWVMRRSMPPDIETGDPAAVNRWLRRVFEKFVVDMSVPGVRGRTTPAAVTPHWLDPAIAPD